LFQKFKDNNEKIKEKLFLLNNTSNTIATISSKEENEYFSLRLKIFEDNNKQMHLQADISSIEVMLNQKQLTSINHFFKVFNRINQSYFSNKEVKQTVPTITKEINLIGTKIPIINLTFNLNLMNIVFFEGVKYNYPKLWTFLDYKYPDKLDSSEKIEKHLSYLEENYYIFLISNISLNANMVFAESRNYADLGFDKMYMKYIVYKSKSPFEKYIPENIIQTYENLDMEVKSMRNVDAKFYFNLYNKILKEDNRIENEDCLNSLFISTNLSQYTNINLPSYLNFYFKNSSFDILIFKKNHDQKAQITDLFGNSNKFGARFFSKTESVQNQPYQIKKKTIVSSYLGEISLQFHPIFLFNFTSLLNSNSNRNEEEKEEDNSIYVVQKETIENREMIPNQVSERSLGNVRKILENPVSKNDSFVSRFKFLWFVDKLSVNLFTFQSDTINDFFQRYFNVYVSTMIDKENKQTINRVFPNYLEDISRKEYVICKLVNLEALFCIKTTLNGYEKNINFDFNKLLLLMKSKELFPILNLVNTNSHDLVEINNSVSGILKPAPNDPSKKPNKYNPLFDNVVYENSYSRSSERVKFSILHIKFLSKEISEIQSDITFYYKNIHNLDVPSDERITKQLEIDHQNSIESISTITVKLFIRSQMNLLADSSCLLRTVEFLDNIQYTMSLFKIMQTYIERNSFNANALIKTISKDTSNRNLNFLSINLEIKELNIIIFNSIIRRYTEEMENQLNVGDSLFTLIEDPYMKINLSKIYINLFQYGMLKQTLLSVTEFRILLRKNKFKDQPNYENSRSNYQSMLNLM
jgi:hypothetical protein